MFPPQTIQDAHRGVGVLLLLQLFSLPTPRPNLEVSALSFVSGITCPRAPVLNFSGRGHLPPCHLAWLRAAPCSERRCSGWTRTSRAAAAVRPSPQEAADLLLGWPPTPRAARVRRALEETGPCAQEGRKLGLPRPPGGRAAVQRSSKIPFGGLILGQALMSHRLCGSHGQRDQNKVSVF